MDGVSLLALPTELLMPATPRAAGGRSPPAAGKPGGTVKRAVRHQREPVGRRDDMITEVAERLDHIAPQKVVVLDH